MTSNTTKANLKKMFKIIDSLTDYKVKHIASQVDIKKNILRKGDIKVIIDLIFLQEGKDELSEKEMKEGIGDMLVLFVLEDFKRRGYLKRDSKGRYKDTRIGKMLRKQL